MFTIDNFNSLKQHFFGKHIALIKKHYPKYLSEQNKYNVDEDDLYSILKLSCFSTEQKHKIISNTSIEIENEELVNLIYQIVMAGKEEYRLSENLFETIMNVVPLENKLKLLINQVSFLDKKTITLSLNKLGEPYVLITQSLKKVRVDYTADVLELAKRLEKYKYITSYSTKLSKKVNNRIDKVQFNTGKIE